MALSRCTVFLIMNQLLGRWMVQWTIKNHPESIGQGDHQKLRAAFSKGHLVTNSQNSINQADPAQSEPLHMVEGDKVPVVHIRGMLGQIVWINPTSGNGKSIHGIVIAQGPGYT